ncbi:MAG: hypothetical protein BWZ02_01409 [Lentisphaerae bacterium ADurb.BinA184]|nr:MAG: hypothetical protein BWZ02_01409 [Lentisphaerae bacterium ADurb.BinA184]
MQDAPDRRNPHRQPIKEGDTTVERTRLLAVGLLALSLHILAEAATCTWTGAAGDNRWSTLSANWDAGAGNVVWPQGNDALFDGEPAAPVNVSNGAVQFNQLTVQNIADGAMTIGKISGNDADYLVAVGDATVNVPTGTSLTLPRVGGSVGLTLRGGGTLTTSREFNYLSGGLNILHGTLQRLPIAGNGTVTLLDTSGGNDARLFMRGVNSSWIMPNDLVVQAGSTGTATVENQPTTGSGFTPTLSGNLALNRALTVKATGTQTLAMTLSGTIAGAGDLILQGNGTTAQSFVISGDTTAHSGSIRMVTNTTNKTLRLDGTIGNANIVVGNGVAIVGDGTVVFNVVDDAADLIDRGTGGSLDVTGMTLQPLLSGVQTQTEYVLASSATGVVGPFASILSYGSYTFTVDYDGTELNPGKVVLSVAIPEPASLAVMVFGAVMGRRWRAHPRVRGRQAAASPRAS